MLLIAICIVVTAIVFVILNREETDKLIIMLFGVLFGFAGGMIIAMILGYALPTTVVANEPILLGNLYDNPEIDGHFFLGSGYVDSEVVTYYSYYDEEGFKNFAHMPKESVRTKEDELETPYLVTYRAEFTSPWMNLIGLNLQKTDKKPEFHIPPGSTDSNFTLR